MVDFNAEWPVGAAVIASAGLMLVAATPPPMAIAHATRMLRILIMVQVPSDEFAPNVCTSIGRLGARPSIGGGSVAIAEIFRHRTSRSGSFHIV